VGWQVDVQEDGMEAMMKEITVVASVCLTEILLAAVSEMTENVRQPNAELLMTPK
jgi:hypothetical protein